MGRLDDQDGLVRKDAVEVLTPLEDSQQDSEPESQQDTGHRQRPSSSTSTGVSHSKSVRLHFVVDFLLFVSRFLFEINCDRY